MNNERYVAALEISSSKITGVVGRIADNGTLDVIAIEQEKGIEAVRHGIIQNLEETSVRISRVIDRLQRKASIAPRKISSVFIGLSGRSLRSIPTTVTINLPDDTEINDEIVGRLAAEAWRTPVDASLEIVDAVPRIYKVGKRETHSPVGVVGNSIQAVFDLIVCRPELKRNIERTVVEKLGLEVAGYVVTALAAGQIILNTQEKRLGCMLADIGAETTDVTIYKSGCLRYYATIPLGSRNITIDLTSLNILEEYAEEIKTTSGNALASEKPSTLNLGGLKLNDVSDIIVARSEEIVANIIEQINYAGFRTTDIPGGIICIGGGSKMNGMLDLISNQANLNVLRGRLPDYIRIADTRVPASEAIQVVCVLYAGAVNSTIECLHAPEPKPLEANGDPNEEEDSMSGYTLEEEEGEKRTTTPGRSRRNWLNTITSGFGKIFGTDAQEDDSDLL